MFDQTFSKQVCKWNEALEILPMLNAEIEKLGANYEVHREKACLNSKTFPEIYLPDAPTCKSQYLSIIKNYK